MHSGRKIRSIVKKISSVKKKVLPLQLCFERYAKTAVP